MKKKLKIEELKVQSFVTSISGDSLFSGKLEFKPTRTTEDDEDDSGLGDDGQSFGRTEAQNCWTDIFNACKVTRYCS